MSRRGRIAAALGVLVVLALVAALPPTRSAVSSLWHKASREVRELGDGSGGPNGGSRGSGNGQGTGSQGTGSGGVAGGSSGSGGSGSGSGSRPGGGSGGSGVGVGQAAEVDSASVGEMALSYLRSAPHGRLVVEVDAAQGVALNAASLDTLRTRLTENLGKSGGISIETGGSFSSSRSAWSLSDIRAAEQANRSRHSSGSTATMWVGVFNGSYAEDDSVLGVAYSASSFAVFPERIAAAGNLLVSSASIERSVLVHEAGHLLGMVNVGWKSAIDHEDPDHPGHSKNPDSVMYWAIESIDVVDILTGGPPDDFDSDDKADLRTRRSG